MDESYIVGLFFARDEAALAECRRRYGAYCRAIARNILGREADAEECENDVYLAAWNAIPPAQPRSLRAFLGKIARNLALGRYERESAQKRGGGEVTLALEELQECAGGESAEQTLETAELGRSIDRFLRTLPETECSLFLRRYWYLDSMETIARRFGLREGAVKTRLHRTREKLRVFLRKEGYAL